MKNYFPDDALFSDAVLVYGPRKAGTTLLQSLLDGSSAMPMVPGELKLKLLTRQRKRTPPDFVCFFLNTGRTIFPLLIESGPDGLKAKDSFKFPSLSRAQTLELFDCEGYVEKLNELRDTPPTTPTETVRHDIAAFFAALKNAPDSSRMWASKEVGGDPGRVMDFFRAMFPAGKVVFLVRDPLFVVRSIILERRRRDIELSFRDIMRECFEAQNIVNYAAQHVEGRGIVVAYELLTRDTPKEMARVAQSLGIPDEPILTTPTTLGVPIVVHTSSQATQKVFQQPTDWTRDLSRQQILFLRAFTWAAPILYTLFRVRFARYKWTRYAHLLRRLEASR